MTRRDHLVFGVCVLILALVVTYGFVQRPGYTDAYYYINAANRLVTGQGLTDAYLWNYIGMPDQLPAPSHAYWMPMASLLAALGMWLLRAPEAYWAAQVPFALLLALLGYTTFWLAEFMGGQRRHAWAAGLIVIMGGYYGRFWGVAEGFTPFGVYGAGCLIALGRGILSRKWGWFVLAGVLVAAGHLTRADGILLILAGLAAIAWLWNTPWTWRERVLMAVILVVSYGLTMLPWMLRNVSAIGTPLPTGGAQGIWYTVYDDIFNYPPDATLARFFEIGGWPLFFESRWTGLSTALGTWIAVEGFVILAPLMVVGLVKRIRDPFLRPFWIYALGLHLAMSLVFPFPGYRGGLLHSATALIPFWVVLGLLGLDDVIDMIAKRRRRWNAGQAKWVYTVAVVILVASLSVWIGWQGWPEDRFAELYRSIDAMLPEDARVMVNDPSLFYYYTGRGGVVLPNETPDVIPEIAQRFQITQLLLEGVNADNIAEGATVGLMNIPAAPPDFLVPVPLESPTVRLYHIEVDR